MQNGFLLESSRNQSTEAPLRPCCGLLEPEEREDIVLALPHIPPAHFPLYLTRCECHVVLSGTFACVAVSGGEVCLFCVTEEKKKTAPCVVCCVIWSLALTVTNTRPSSVAGYVLSDGAACSLCQVIIQPRVSPRFAPLLHHNYFKKKKKKEGKNTSEQSFVLILGCREGWVSAWVWIGIYTGFYCHSILKIHFCHHRIL